MKYFIEPSHWEEAEEDFDFNPPVFVTGVARSGTSLTTSILSACGAWTGQTMGPSMAMPTGFMENMGIREAVLKPLFKSVLGDVTGQATGLEPQDFDSLCLDTDLIRNIMEGICYIQGLEDGEAWVYKDPKLLSLYEIMVAAFPSAKWVIVHRDHDAIINSCKNTEFMNIRGDLDWEEWVRFHEGLIEKMKRHPKVQYTEVDYADLIDFNFTDIKAFVDETDGLEWDEDEVEAQIL